MKEKILLTGSAGFIGSNFCKYIIPNYTKYNWVSIDKLVDNFNINFIPTNHKFYFGDFADSHFVNRLFEIEKPDFCIHMGAESFVDNSIENPAKFSHSNVVGTQVLVEASCRYNLKRFIYVSTDEIYHQLISKNDLPWGENFPPNPRNNYSASKLGGELVVKAANQVRGLQYNISRCCNNYGKAQPFRNLFPKIVLNILHNKPIPIHGDGSPIREYIRAEDHCQALMDILEFGVPNEVYNVGTGVEYSNLEMVYNVAKILNKDPKIEYQPERLGQDWRYAINSNKIRSLGWSPKISFDDGIVSAIDWYKSNLHLFNV